MRFDVPPESYDAHIGRYAREIAPRFLAFSGADALQKGPVLDVGCGPGALTAWLAQRFGGKAVCAVDPSEKFAAACAQRVPGADVRVASVEALPFKDRTFGAALAQLVFTFLPDPVKGAREMARVVRPGGIVAACTFEAQGLAISRAFWEAALRLDPAAPDDSKAPLRSEAALLDVWRQAGVKDPGTTSFEVEVDYDGFEDLWQPLAAGVGPTAAYLKAQPEDRRAALRDATFELLGKPPGAFTLPARVVAVRGKT